MEAGRQNPWSIGTRRGPVSSAAALASASASPSPPPPSAPLRPIWLGRGLRCTRRLAPCRSVLKRRISRTAMRWTSRGEKREVEKSSAQPSCATNRCSDPTLVLRERNGDESASAAWQSKNAECSMHATVVGGTREKCAARSVESMRYAAHSLSLCAVPRSRVRASLSHTAHAPQPRKLAQNARLPPAHARRGGGSAPRDRARRQLGEGERGGGRGGGRMRAPPSPLRARTNRPQAGGWGGVSKSL